MRASIIRKAQAIDSLQAAKSKILPPLPLYRNLLRVHRRLPIEMRSLGDDYLKSEFKRHKQADNPVHIMGFLLEWNRYLDELQYQLSRNSEKEFRGKRMDETLFEQVSNHVLEVAGVFDNNITDVQ